MKRTLTAVLAALMLLTLLPFASLPAQACTDFELRCIVSYAYVGENIIWYVINEQGTGPFEYAFDMYKDGEHFDEEEYHSNNSRHFKPTSPGKYMVKVWVRGKHFTVVKDSLVVDVKANPNKITKVEPLGPTSLRITWNKVPGAIMYYLERSTDMKNWTLVKWTSATAFANTYLQPGTRYFYKVEYDRPDNSYNPVQSPDSNIASGVPMAKTSITSITSPSKGRVRLAWSKAAGASGYQVVMATSSNGSYKTVRILPGTTVTFSGVKSGSFLYFKVRPYRRVYTTTYWGLYSAQRGIRVK